MQAVFEFLVEPPTIAPPTTTTTTLPPPIPAATDPFVISIPGPRQCGETEIRSDCVRCERTCANRHLNIRCENDVPCEVGCACLDGLIRFGDRCVYVNDCPLIGKFLTVIQFWQCT